MHLTSRIAIDEQRGSDPEDVFSSSLATLFSDDIANQHGDGDHGLVYTSPHLPRPLRLELAKPLTYEDRHLFSHYLWNASLLLAELVERDSLLAHQTKNAAEARKQSGDSLGADVDFDVRGLDIMELGAGTALPSMMAGLLGARRVLVTDYPAAAFIETLQRNIANNVKCVLAPNLASFSQPYLGVQGHAWGEIDDSLSSCPTNQHCFDRLFVCDCLWMPAQHRNLQRSISHFLRKSGSARAWVIAGFHTGRAKMSTFFKESWLAAVGLEVCSIWERDSDGNERAWSWDLEEDPTFRKRWLVIASLKRTQDFIEI